MLFPAASREKQRAASVDLQPLQQFLKVIQEQQTQIFIETPYRNNHILADLLKNCHPRTRICVALNISAADEMIVTKQAMEWKKDIPALAKQLW